MAAEPSPGAGVEPHITASVEFTMSTFAIYLIGFLLFVSGLAYGAYMLGV
ncbi:hypothetical protein [Hyphomonas sediminis]|nr:hypothetical protein [Hyphomonas sediminis]